MKKIIFLITLLVIFNPSICSSQFPCKTGGMYAVGPGSTAPCVSPNSYTLTCSCPSGFQSNHTGETIGGGKNPSWSSQVYICLNCS